MGQRYIIDTNAVIDYVGDKLPLTAALEMDKLIDDELNTSIVIKIEVLGFNGVPTEMQKRKDFLTLANTFYVDDRVTDKAIFLRKFYKKLQLGDAIIAATALVHGFTVVSRNTKDFENIEGLNCLNPYDL